MRLREFSALVPLICRVLGFACYSVLLAEASQSPSTAFLMPHVSDYTLMHWAEGFPSVVPSAPWRRVIETGSYAFVLDTETLRVPHFGVLKKGFELCQCSSGWAVFVVITSGGGIGDEVDRGWQSVSLHLGCEVESVCGAAFDRIGTLHAACGCDGFGLRQRRWSKVGCGSSLC